MGIVDSVRNVASKAVTTARSVEHTVEAAASAVKQKASAAVTSASSTAFRADTFASGNIVGAWRGQKDPVSLDGLKRGWTVAKETWKGPNTGRALSTEVERAKLKLKHPGSMHKLTPQVSEALVRGVAEARTDSERGKKGILGEAQVRDAATTVMKLDPGQSASLDGLLQRAGQRDGKPVAGADAQAERALILKAVAARKDQLTSPEPGVRAKAMGEVEQFAADIRAVERKELIRTTTPLDVDDVNVSKADATKPGVTDDQKDNDGLTQKFGNTCGPTTGQMMRAEEDPVFARALSREGLNEVTKDGTAGKDQASVMAAASDKTRSAVGRDEVDDLDGVRTLVNSNPSFTSAERRVLNDHFVGKGVPEADKPVYEAGLQKLRRARPDLDDGRMARLAQVGKDQGGLDDVGRGIKGGAQSNLTERPVAGNIDASFEDVRARVKDGQTVGIRIGYARHNDKTGKMEFTREGHAMLISDFRDGKYLVSDPYSGKTAWVTEKDLRRGHIGDAFGLDPAYLTHTYTKP